MAKTVAGFSADMSYDILGNPIFKTVTKLSDGSNLQKTLSFEDFKKLFDVSTKIAEDKYRSIPKLPKYYYDGGVTKKRDSFWVALFVPAEKRQFYYQTTEEMLFVPYPNMLFMLKVGNGVVNSRFCYAIADNELTDTSILYQYPYGHVSTSGSICMGSCSTTLNSLSESDSFVESFVLGSNQGHYYQNNEMSRKNVSLRELLSLVEKKGYFPSEWLMPMTQPNGKPLTYRNKAGMFNTYR